MRRLLARVSVFVSVVVVPLAAFSSAGCLGSKQTWRSQTVTSAEARISPLEVYRRKDRLFIRVTYTNLSNEMVTVDRDALQLQLENGRLLGRSTGTTSTHATYSIPPNGAHSIYVDFRDDDLEYERNAALVWKSAVFAGSREVMVPYTPVTAR